MAASKSYGSVNVPQGAGEFDEKNTYYLNNENGFNWKRFCRAIVPIVVALLIMGGFAYGMSHGFRHLYGPTKGESVNDNSIKEDESWIVDEDKPAEVKVDGSSSLHKKCSKNENCVPLGLGGNCCPTDDGIMLDCCGP